MNKKYLLIPIVSISLFAFVIHTDNKSIQVNKEEMYNGKDIITSALETTSKAVTTSAKNNSNLKKNNFGITVKENYLLNVNGLIYYIMHIEKPTPFDNYDKVKVTGKTKDTGEVKEIKDVEITKSLLGSHSNNYLDIPYMYKDNEYILAIEHNNTNYSSYEFTFSDYDLSKDKTLKVIDKYIYTSNDSSLPMYDFYNFIKNKAHDILAHNKNIAPFKYKDLTFDFVSAKYSEDKYKIQFDVTNSGEDISNELFLSIKLISEEGQMENLYMENLNLGVKEIEPNKTERIIYSNKRLEEGKKFFEIKEGKEYLFEIVIADLNGNESKVYRYKSTF